MKKHILMILLTLATIAFNFTATPIYATTQDEILNRLKEAGIESAERDPVTGQGIPAPGHEFGGNFDSLVDSAKQANINAAKQRAAERGLTVQQYLDQTGQSHAAKYFDQATLGASSSTTTEETKPQETHTHSYTEKVTKEATCSEPGVKTFTCDCGKSYTEEIPVTGHIYTDKVSKEATCTEPGVVTYTCECGDTYEEELPVVDHEKGAVKTTKEATCTEAGERTVYCKYCGEAMHTETIEAYGHTEGTAVVEKEATMFTKGILVTHCEECGEILHSKEIPVVMQNWYIIGAVAVVLLAGIVIVLTKNKKNKF